MSFPLASEGYTFGSKTITIQQYDPSNANAVYTLYNVRELINNNGGVIQLANLSGTYASQVPYAYFKVMFS